MHKRSAHPAASRALYALLCLCLLLTVLPAQADSLSIAVVYNPNAADRLHLRAAARTDAVSLGKYYNGVEVVVLEFVSDIWLYVSVAGVQGYMQRQYLAVNPAPGSVAPATPTLEVANNNAGERLNLRESMSTSAASLGKYYNGTQVRVLGICGDWYHVLVDGKTGYMQAQYLSRDLSGTSPASPIMPQASTGVFAIVNMTSLSDQLNLRASASESASSLGKYPNGTTVEVLSANGSWWQVRAGDRQGYMSSKYLLADSQRVSLVTLSRGIVRSPSGNDHLNLRAAPYEGSESLGRYKNSTLVEILGTAGVWYRVRVLDDAGNTGYMLSQFLDCNFLANNQHEGRSFAVVANPSANDRLNLRAAASETGTSLGRYFNGTQVELLGPPNANNWYRVRVGGQEGYMNGAFLRLLEPSWG